MVQTCNTGYSKLENECARAPHGILPQGPPPINTQPRRYECRPGLSTWPQCSHGGRPPSSTDPGTILKKGRSTMPWVELCSTLCTKRSQTATTSTRNDAIIKITSNEVIFSCGEPWVDPGFPLLFQNLDWPLPHPFRVPSASWAFWCFLASYCHHQKFLFFCWE